MSEDRSLKRWFTLGWIGWGLWFLVLEGIALFQKDRGDTLSEHVWWWRGKAGSFGFASIAALLAWLLYHFLLEG
jgi:hypothetical protein